MDGEENQGIIAGQSGELSADWRICCCLNRTSRNGGRDAKGLRHCLEDLYLYPEGTAHGRSVNRV